MSIFQDRVQGWMQLCFGAEISADKLERNDRFIEEALELVQSLGYDAARAHALVDYVFGRPVGVPEQEVGGVMVTLAALCAPNGLDMAVAGEVELERILHPDLVAKIRAKQAAKPTGSALPVPGAKSGATHRHKKRGTEYVLIGIGKLQSGSWIDTSRGDFAEADNREVAIYRSAVDPNELWARPREEFEDGRFEVLS